jgi:hypothetical protein
MCAWFIKYGNTYVEFNVGKQMEGFRHKCSVDYPIGFPFYIP